VAQLLLLLLLLMLLFVAMATAPLRHIVARSSMMPESASSCAREIGEDDVQTAESIHIYIYAFRH